jgi:hypothetical protein
VIRQFVRNSTVFDFDYLAERDKFQCDRVANVHWRLKATAMQLILGTVSLHGVSYPGHKIHPDTEFGLLKDDEYDNVAEYVAPFFDQIMNPDVGVALL